MPENLGAADKPYALATGTVEVFTFNAGKAVWGVGKSFELTLTEAQTKATETLILKSFQNETNTAILQPWQDHGKSTQSWCRKLRPLSRKLRICKS
jgi:hypothetical protein